MRIIPDAAERLDETTRKNLDRIVKNRLNNKYDFVLLVVGDVGKGKSSLASLLCSYVDPSFTPERIIYEPLDYIALERKLKPKQSLQFDEAEEVFFSRNTMGRRQKQMVLKFAQIRQKSYFIILCVPSLMMLEKWFRGLGEETRINAIIRVVRRGKFYVYSGKSGTMGKIKIVDGQPKYPSPDYVGYWKHIPESSGFWREYMKKKERFLNVNRESVRISKAREATKKQLGDSLTIADIREIDDVGESTVRDWLKQGIFPRRYVFPDMSGRIRVRFKGYQIGKRKLERLKTKRLAISLFKRGK